VPDTTDLTATRELSRTLFGGAQYRIEVGAAIAESDGILCMVDLVKLLGDPPGKSSVNAELKVLERANLLARPDVRRERRVHLIRQNNLYWNMCRELRDTTAVKRARQGRRASRA
jgi:hypothetical protein